MADRRTEHPVLTWAGKRASEAAAAGAGELIVEEIVLPAAGEGVARPPLASTRRRADASAIRIATPAPTGAPLLPRGRLICGDNLLVARALGRELAGKIDLLYVDPPFATGADFALQPRATDRAGALKRGIVAYSDTWAGGITAYLDAMAARLRTFRELLSDKGTIFLHCDWRTSHYLRCLLDEIFGADAFKNEIVWRYRRWPARTRVFQRMHDTLLWYGKRPGDAHVYNPQFEPLAPSTLATFGTKRQIADFSTGRRKPSQTDEESPGAPMSDVWDIGIIAPIARERVGYPTQKPEALLERIVRAASAPGDLVADFFCGSGTTLAVAERLGRRWIGCDVGRAAIETTKRRLADLGPRTAFEIAALDGEGPGARVTPSARGKPSATRARERGPEIVIQETRDGGVRVALTGFVPAERPAGAPASWEDLVDSWAVDFAFDGRTFVNTWRAHRARPEQPLALVSAVHRHAFAGQHRIAVKVVDVYGRASWAEATWRARAVADDPDALSSTAARRIAGRRR